MNRRKEAIMFRVLIVFVFFIFITSCNGQNETKNKDEHISDGYVKPKTDIKVHKEYDDEGNLIRYDSAYTWSYSNVQGDSIFVDIDSAMMQFQSFMNDRRQFGFPFFNKDFFYSDSLFYHDFLNQDYFMNRWMENRYDINRAIQEMDSIKSLFFQQQYPEMELKQK